MNATPPGQRFVSADNHLNLAWLPADLWQQRLPRALRDQGPRVEETGQGSYWVWEGKRRKESAAGSSGARLLRKTFPDSELAAGSLPPSDPALARRHMAMAGIEAAVFYGDTRKWEVRDPALRLAMYRAYNDFALELSAAEPRRLVWLPQLPTWDVAESLAELQRVTALDARSVEFGMFDVEVPLLDPAWEPLWSEAEARGVVISSHTGKPAGTPFAPWERGERHAAHAAGPFCVSAPLAQLVFSGVFERHPSLSWVVAECRIGWLPFLFEWMDRQLDVRGNTGLPDLPLLPSETIRRNVRFTFEDDAVGARLLDAEWSCLKDVVMWGVDYPHPQDVWPGAQAAADRLFAHLDPQVRNEIVHSRAATLYGLDTQSA